MASCVGGLQYKMGWPHRFGHQMRLENGQSAVCAQEGSCGQPGSREAGPALLYNQPSPGNSLQNHPSATCRPRTTSKHCNPIQFPPSQHQQFLTSGLNVSMSSGAASHSNHSMAHAAHTPSPFAPMDLEVLSVSFGVTQHVPSVSEGGPRMQSPVCHQSGGGITSLLQCVKPLSPASPRLCSTPELNL